MFRVQDIEFWYDVEANTIPKMKFFISILIASNLKLPKAYSTCLAAHSRHSWVWVSGPTN